MNNFQVLRAVAVTHGLPDRPLSSVPPDESSPEFRVKQRFALQKGAKLLLDNNKSIQGCCAWLQKAGEGVPLYSYPGLKKARFGNLQTCASVWACPLCSAKISERRRSLELAPGLVAARAKGWSVLLVTSTLRHTQQDQLSALIAGLKTCRKRSRSGKRMARLRAKYGIEGSIRVFEVTHGANGWHPHIHELLFLSCDYDRAALLSDLSKQWADGVRLAGLSNVNEHGVRISDAHEKIEEYVTKFGRDPKWGLAEEVSKQQVKKARSSKGRAPFQLLSDFTFGGDIPAGALFREYAEAMKGEHQLYWTPGLKAALGVKEMTDEQIEQLEEREKQRITLDTLTDPEWALIRADDVLGGVWNLTAAGDKVALDDFLRPYRSTCTNTKVTLRDAVQLVDWSADERDRIPSIAETHADPILHDPLARRLLSGGAHAPSVPGIVQRLRERQSGGEELAVFGLMADDRRNRSRLASNVMPWKVVRRGRSPLVSVLAANPEYCNTAGPDMPALQNHLEL